jgi:hypothetical protein
VHQQFRRKFLGNCPRRESASLTVLIHIQLMKAAHPAVGWKIMNHPTYSSDLAPSYFHLFGAMKVHIGGQKFQTDDELKHCVWPAEGMCNLVAIQITVEILYLSYF